MAVDRISPHDGLAPADVIRDAIRQRLLPPGAPLIQTALADALGISKIPVREALHALASEGLVTFTGDGAHVTLLTAEEVDELWTLRSLLEPAMAEGIVRNASPDDIAALGRHVAAMDDAPDGDSWSEVNYAFHLELYRIARLPLFAAAARRVLTQIEPHSRVAVNRLQGRGAAQAEHHEMVAAIGARDAGALREILERHSTRARTLLAGHVRDAAEPSGSPLSEAARAFAGRLGPVVAAAENQPA